MRSTPPLARLLATGLLVAPLAGVLADALPERMVSTLCVHKTTGKTRIVDHLPNQTCRSSEVKYRNSLKVFDANHQFLGFAPLGSNDPYPYNIEVYNPVLNKKISLGLARGTGSPDQVIRTHGDIASLDSLVYPTTDCTGQGYASISPTTGVFRVPTLQSYFTWEGSPTDAVMRSRTVTLVPSDPNDTPRIDCWDDAANLRSGIYYKIIPVSLPFTAPFPLPLTYE